MAVAQKLSAKRRLHFLDLSKGILVILMVVYHTLNYTNQYHLGFRYLSFLPPSFILITGFVISHVYTSRYRADERSLVQRVLARGAKLLALFTVLNIISQFVRSPAYGQSIGVANFFRRWNQVYLEGSERGAVFEVLLPISYLLLLAPVLLRLAHYSRLFLPLLSLCYVGACALLDRLGSSLINLNLISAGVLGMMIGQLIANTAVLGRYVWLALAAYCVYLPLGIARGYVYSVQLLGAVVALAFICSLSVRLGHHGWWQQRVIRLGQYSLLAYIAQIAILQFLSRILGRPDPLSLDSSALFVGTLIFMTMIVEGTEWLRNHSFGAERLYKVVFA
jgi:peptidoglycan/LPS O-acetylase OafA/YrhL